MIPDTSNTRQTLSEPGWFADELRIGGLVDDGRFIPQLMRVWSASAESSASGHTAQLSQP
jgi:hypothetical protein